MKHQTRIQDQLPSVILAALAKLDQKGTDEKITQAMEIVFEAFRMNAEGRSFSPEDLFDSAMCRKS